MVKQDLCLISMKHSKNINSQKVLFVLCVIALALPNICLFFTEQMPLLARVCNVVLPVSVYWWVMTLNSRPGRAFLWSFPLAFFAAFQIVLLYLFGNSVISVDMFLNIVTTNFNEAGELLGNIYPSVIFVVVVYLPLIVWSALSLRCAPIEESFRRANKRWAKRGMMVGLVLLVANCLWDKDYEAERDLYPVNVAYNAVLAVDRNIKIGNYHNASHDFTFNAVSARDATEKELYVLVIGETARAANFGVYGYERNTTPLLGKLSNFVVFKQAFTQSNTTHKSVPMLISGVSADDYNDIYYQKSIITAFKEAGYSTAYFSNQRRNNSFIDYFGEEADVAVFLKDSVDIGGNVYDTELLARLDDYLAHDRSAKRFVVLQTYGSHFNYRERYPIDKAYYKPDNYASASSENRQAIVNAYDNTIRATDELLSEVVKMVEGQGVSSAVMYVSDHGEDIYDNEENHFLHASPIPTLYQLHVPLLVWTSPSYSAKYAMKCAALRDNAEAEVATSLAVFHTLFDIADINTPYKKDNSALSNKDFKSQPYLKYLDDHNEPVAVSELCR